MQIIASWQFDWRYMVRGLTIDKQRGNILKIDRHKYVKVAYHGFRELSRQERRAVYSDGNVSCSALVPHCNPANSCCDAVATSCQPL